MINNNFYLSLIIFCFIGLFLLITYSNISIAESSRSCGKELPILSLHNRVENNFNFGKINEIVLLEGTCSQLKSGACGTGTCEKGGSVWIREFSAFVLHHSNLEKN